MLWRYDDCSAMMDGKSGRWRARDTKSELVWLVYYRLYMYKEKTSMTLREPRSLSQ